MAKPILLQWLDRSVIDASYNSTSNQITFTKNDGSTISVDLSELHDSFSDEHVNGASFAGNTLTLTRAIGTDITVDLSSLDVSDSNTYVSGASFNTTNGVLSLTRTGDITGTIQVDLDGKYVNIADVDDVPVNGATTTPISSNWAFDNVKTPVPAGAVFTDTNTQRTDENIRDVIGAALVAGTNVNIDVDDAGNTITINSTDTNTQRAIHDTPSNGATTTSISSNWAFDHNAGTGNGKHVPAAGSPGQYLKHDGTWGTPPNTDTNTQRSDEEIQDVVGNLLVGGTNVTLNYDDVGNTLTVNATDTNTWRSVHDTPQDGATTTSISSNWAFDNVKTAVPAGALFTDTNNYLSGASFNTGDGVLTLTRNGLSNLTVDLDGRYFDLATNNQTVNGSTIFNSTVVFNDSKFLYFGTHSDFRIQHNNTNAYLDAIKGNIIFRGSGPGYETLVEMKPNNAIDLYYDGTKRFETTATGANIIGTLTVDGTAVSVDGHSHAYDNYNNWKLQANGGATTDISSAEAVNFTGSGATSVSRSGNTITISSTDTNTDTNYYLTEVNTTDLSKVDFTISGASDVVDKDFRPTWAEVFAKSGSAKIPESYLPAIAITDTFVAANQTAQLALTVQKGDICVRTDQNKSYVALNATNATMTDWQELLTPTDGVLSVNGNTGAVTTVRDQISNGVTNTSPSENAVYDALAGKSNTTHTHTLASITEWNATVETPTNIYTTTIPYVASGRINKVLVGGLDLNITDHYTLANNAGFFQITFVGWQPSTGWEIKMTSQSTSTSTAVA